MPSQWPPRPRSGGAAVARTGRFFVSQFGAAIDWGEGLCATKDGSGRYYLAGTADFGTFDPTVGFTAGADFRWYVMRLTSSMTLDPTFGAGGVCILDFGNNDMELTSIVIDSNGKIVCGGIDYAVTPARTVKVARFNTDGTLDAAFANYGVASFTPSTTVYFALGFVGIQSTGKIVVMTGEDIGGKRRAKLWRLNPNGAQDLTWGTAGVATYAYNSGNNDTYPVSLLVGAGDKVYVGGMANNSNLGGAHHLGFVAGFTSAGAADNTWGVDTGGGNYAVTLDTPQAKECMFTALLQEAGGKIVAVGDANSDATHTGVILARFTTAGVLDSGGSFGAGAGYAITNFGLQGNDSIDWAAFDSGGKIMAAGQTGSAGSNYYTPTTRFTAYRFDANGAADAAYGTSGVVAPAPNGDNQNDSVFYGAGSYAAILGTNALVLPGHVNADTLHSVGALVKLTAAGAVDTTVGDVLSAPAVTAPTATTSAASSITTTGATLNGSVTGQAGSTTYYQFEYGLTAGVYPYRSAVPASVAVSDGSAHAVSAAVTGLLSGYTYHFRLVATTYVGDTAKVSYGSDLNFTTTGGGTNTIFSDTFTDADGTLLQVHTPDINYTGGNFWVQQFLAGSASIQSNKFTTTNDTIQTVNIGLDTGFTIQADFTRNSAGAPELDLRFRYLNTSNYWNILCDGTNFKIIERVAGGNTTRATTAFSWPNGETHTVKAVVSGTTVTATIDGANSISYGSIASLGGNYNVGFELFVSGSAVDNYLVTVP